MIGTPVKFPIRNFILDRADNRVIRQTIIGNICNIHDFLKVVGNNILASFLFNTTDVNCFWYFNNDIFSVIAPLTYNKVEIFSIQFSTLYTRVLFVILFENYLTVKNYQIYKFLTAHSIKCLPPKIGG